MSSIPSVTVQRTAPSAQATPAVLRKTPPQVQPHTQLQSNTSKAAPVHRQQTPNTVDITV
jgi:hypothetical protein